MKPYYSLLGTIHNITVYENRTPIIDIKTQLKDNKITTLTRIILGRKNLTFIENECEELLKYYGFQKYLTLFNKYKIIKFKQECETFGELYPQPANLKLSYTELINEQAYRELTTPQKTNPFMSILNPQTLTIPPYMIKKKVKIQDDKLLIQYEKLENFPYIPKGLTGVLNIETQHPTLTDLKQFINDLIALRTPKPVHNRLKRKLDRALSQQHP